METKRDKDCAPAPREPYPAPRIVAWEMTRRCPLSCRHCRAASAGTYNGELSTGECMRVLDNIAVFAKPIIILTGGEPMLRSDIYHIAARASELGLRVVMAPCGFLLDHKSASRMLDTGIRLISISLDGARPKTHDTFRGREGAFEATLKSIGAAKAAGLGFQINTTVSRHNMDELPQILEMAARLGAAAFNPFMLVPTGRGRELVDQELSPEEYERVLRWLAGERNRDDIQIRVTCGPYYQRIIRQQPEGSARTAAPHAGGCLGGKSFTFISHRGKVQICGFLEVEYGDLRQEGYDFHRIWHGSEVFRKVRDVDSYHGRCGMCEYRRVCGGCRARAFATGGDYLGEELRCAYSPRAGRTPPVTEAEAELNHRDRQLLSAIQCDLPVCNRPFERLGKRMGRPAGRLLARLRKLHSAGYIRRVGAIFDHRRLGFVSTLVAAKVPPEKIEQVALTVNELPGVSHNYRRTHDYNLWFTLRDTSEDKLKRTIQTLREQTGIQDIYSLPALKVYNHQVLFKLDGSPVSAGRTDPTTHPPTVSLSRKQKELVRALQWQMPLVSEPYAEIARLTDRPLEQVLSQIQQWLEKGVIRRMGAVLNHRKVGFKANGMTVFRAPLDRIDALGARLKQYPNVTHCYRRPRLPEFPYNLFAMVHGQTVEEARRHVSLIATELGLPRYEILFSVEEYKKTSPSYFAQS